MPWHVSFHIRYHNPFACIGHATACPYNFGYMLFINSGDVDIWGDENLVIDCFSYLCEDYH